MRPNDRRKSTIVQAAKLNGMFRLWPHLWLENAKLLRLSLRPEKFGPWKFRVHWTFSITNKHKFLFVSIKMQQSPFPRSTRYRSNWQVHHLWQWNKMFELWKNQEYGFDQKSSGNQWFAESLKFEKILFEVGFGIRRVLEEAGWR